MRNLVLIILCLFSIISFGQSTLTATYFAGDIPTSFDSFDSGCNGPLTTLSISFPAENGNYTVTGIDITYEMTALGSGWISDQRSQVFCQNTATLEDGISMAPGNVSGTQVYSRNGVNIANGIYSANELLIFEMRAWRTFGEEASQCNVNFNKVNDGLWKIVVYYTFCPSEILLTNQTEVNNFLSNFSGCSTQFQSLQIGAPGSPSDITDISGLAFIESVNGVIQIINNPILQEVNFSNLTDAGALEIAENAQLDSIYFPDMEDCELTLVIRDNPLITNFSFPQLLSATGILVENNNLLTQFSFPAASEIFQIYIEADFFSEFPSSNNTLITFDFSSLETAGLIALGCPLAVKNIAFPNLLELDELQINCGIDVNTLETISMPMLTEARKIQLLQLQSLNTIDLSSLIVINDDLIITGDDLVGSMNTALSDISSLANLELISGQLTISGFQSLNNCCFISYFFPDVCLDIQVGNNGPECSDWHTIQNSCMVNDPDGDGKYGVLTDNCPDQFNPEQQDNDNDGIGNHCDNCPLMPNPDQEDLNNNFIGDICENAEVGKVGINTENPKVGLEILASELYLNDTQRGLIMKNAIGECFRLIVNIEGELQTVKITCPE